MDLFVRHCSWLTLVCLIIVVACLTHYNFFFIFSFGHAFRLTCFVKNEQESNGPVTSVELTLKPVDAPDTFQMTIKAICSVLHPFFVPEKGWVSLDPQSTQEVYGIRCLPLRVGDTIMASPPPTERLDGSWTSMDSSGANILAEWAARVSHDIM
jgi:hypothetical protein